MTVSGEDYIIVQNEYWSAIHQHFGECLNPRPAGVLLEARPAGGGGEGVKGTI